MSRVYEPEIAAALARRVGCSTLFAREMLREMKETIADRLAAGDETVLTNFGLFYCKRVGAKTLRHPQTGKPIRVQERRCPAWRASARLKARVREAGCSDA